MNYVPEFADCYIFAGTSRLRRFSTERWRKVVAGREGGEVSRCFTGSTLLILR